MSGISRGLRDSVIQEASFLRPDRIVRKIRRIGVFSFGETVRLRSALFTSFDYFLLAGILFTGFFRIRIRDVFGIIVTALYKSGNFLKPYASTACVCTRRMH